MPINIIPAIRESWPKGALTGLLVHLQISKQDVQDSFPSPDRCLSNFMPQTLNSKVLPSSLPWQAVTIFHIKKKVLLPITTLNYMPCASGPRLYFVPSGSCHLHASRLAFPKHPLPHNFCLWASLPKFIVTTYGSYGDFWFNPGSSCLFVLFCLFWFWGVFLLWWFLRFGFGVCFVLLCFLSAWHRLTHFLIDHQAFFLSSVLRFCLWLFLHKREQVLIFGLN